MIGLYTPEQMREMDSFLIDGGTISGYALMNNAASAALDAIIRLIPDLYERPVVIFCGKGNNGGDGLCILRMLHVSGCDVKALLMTDSFSGDAGMAFDDAVRSGCSMTRFAPGERFGENAVIIDALFGTGLNRELHGTFPEAIEAINLSGARIVSVDIPSGINGENGQIMGCAVRAHATVTFQYLKPGLLLFPGRSYAGRVITVSIDDRYPKPETAMYTLEAGDIRSWIPEQQADDYKGKNGKALILAGSRNYAGAALMCTASALRTGAGLTYCAVPHDLKTQFSALPEAISVPLGLEGEDSWTAECCRGARELLLGKDVICAGPGMGRIEDPGLIADVLKTGIPCVLDADALNCVAANRDYAPRRGNEPADGREHLRYPVGSRPRSTRVFKAPELRDGPEGRDLLHQQRFAMRAEHDRKSGAGQRRERRRAERHHYGAPCPETRAIPRCCRRILSAGSVRRDCAGASESARNDRGGCDLRDPRDGGKTSE